MADEQYADIPMKKLPFVRSANNYDRNAASDASGLRCDDKSLTKQSFADEVDINTIVKRFGVTGELPQGVRVPTYGDFTGVSDFHSAVNAVAQANESFDAMAAEVRAKFHNDPAEFIEFCSDPANSLQLEKWGMLVPRPAPIVAPEVVPEPKKGEKKGGDAPRDAQ